MKHVRIKGGGAIRSLTNHLRDITDKLDQQMIHMWNEVVSNDGIKPGVLLFQRFQSTRFWGKPDGPVVQIGPWSPHNRYVLPKWHRAEIPQPKVPPRAEPQRNGDTPAKLEEWGNPGIFGLGWIGTYRNPILFNLKDGWTEHPVFLVIIKCRSMFPCMQRQNEHTIEG